ncbi:hypothetical protein GJ744_000668 [Endocarpon pusillum]|uniref:Uncharacterized protein n=1 Tax=Endocarpon pusillum TaxID=364733 RepID=A0A8H7E2E0_9EURO|nr:hypothetical protein GJ744_000668 [Endocarpon pusillum]
MAFYAENRSCFQFEDGSERSRQWQMFWLMIDLDTAAVVDKCRGAKVESIGYQTNVNSEGPRLDPGSWNGTAGRFQDFCWWSSGIKLPRPLGWEEQDPSTAHGLLFVDHVVVADNDLSLL